MSALNRRPLKGLSKLVGRVGRSPSAACPSIGSCLLYLETPYVSFPARGVKLPNQRCNRRPSLFVGKRDIR